MQAQSCGGRPKTFRNRNYVQGDRPRPPFIWRNQNHERSFHQLPIVRREASRALAGIHHASDPEDLRAELGAARLLAQEAMDAGQTALASRLLETVAKCAQGQVATQRAKGELMERVVVLRIATAICNLLGAALEHHNLPDRTRRDPRRGERRAGRRFRGDPTEALTDERGKQ